MKLEGVWINIQYPVEANYWKETHKFDVLLFFFYLDCLCKWIDSAWLYFFSPPWYYKQACSTLSVNPDGQKEKRLLNFKKGGRKRGRECLLFSFTRARLFFQSCLFVRPDKLRASSKNSTKYLVQCHHMCFDSPFSPLSCKVWRFVRYHHPWSTRTTSSLIKQRQQLFSTFTKALN